MQTLAEIHEIMLRFMQCAISKETALREDDITMLKDILEQEEDIIIASAELEKKRAAQTAELVSELGIEEENVSLRHIAQHIAHEETRNALLEIGDKLGKAVFELRERNDILNEVISLKNDYAGVILEALTVGSDTPRNYNAFGTIEQQSEDSPGVVEYFA